MSSPTAPPKLTCVRPTVQQPPNPTTTTTTTKVNRRMLARSGTSKHHTKHAYLSGNFAPIQTESPLTDCEFVGEIPEEFFGSEYVRNGGNPMANSRLDRDAHWFDADGMLCGVLFRRVEGGGGVRPGFLNRFVLTDVLLATGEGGGRPLLPSISTLVDPNTRLVRLLVEIMRTVVLVVLTWLPGLGGGRGVGRISVANTSVFWHDGCAMVGCESGPPMRVVLPALETAGWYTAESVNRSHNDDDENKNHASTLPKQPQQERNAFGGGPPILRMLREFTTAHPKLDPTTQELLLYHMCFEPPYLRISVIPPRQTDQSTLPPHSRVLKAEAVRGVKQPKMMHDFGASRTHTVIIDMPLSLDMMNLVRGKPILHYDPSQPTRFGVLPRYQPDGVRWFESRQACCIYHTANTWDDAEEPTGERMRGVNMLACRLNSATLVYSAGNLLPPSHVLPPANCAEKCQLYYWRFDLEPDEVNEVNEVSFEFALAEVPFEFPTINHASAMRAARYVYGTSMRDGTFDAGLGKAAKIDVLVKVDVETLIRRGKNMWREGRLKRGESVDRRTVEEILAAQRERSAKEEDAIKIFEMPHGWYAQETTFVPRNSADAQEDDGWLVFYVFDEATGLHPSTGEVLPGATSELWIIEAKHMQHIVCRIKLPQRVPYGLHGTLFTEDQIAAQNPVDANQLRSWASSVNHSDPFASTSLGSTMCTASGKAAAAAAAAGGKFNSRSEVYAAFLNDPIRIGAWWIKRNIELLIA